MTIIVIKDLRIYQPNVQKYINDYLVQRVCKSSNETDFPALFEKLQELLECLNSEIAKKWLLMRRKKVSQVTGYNDQIALITL